MTIDTSTLTPTALRQQAALPPEDKGSVRGARQPDTLTTTAKSASEDDGLSFWDVLDVINPLQHIPLVSTIYRELTGDKIGDAARIAGGALFGGPIGLAAAGVDFAVKALTGKHMDEHMVAMVSGDDAPPPATADSPAVAEAGDAVARAAARAPASPAGTASDAAPQAAPQAASETTVASTADGRWFPIGDQHRRNAFMPLSAGAREAEARAAKAAALDAQAQAAAQAKVPAGTVEVHPMGGAGTGKPSAAHLPLGLLQGVPDGPVVPGLPGAGTEAPQPAPEAVRRAMRAHGLEAGAHPFLAAAEAQAAQAAPAAPRPPAGGARPIRLTPAEPAGAASATAASGPTATSAAAGPIAVPAWFDTAMQKALSAYEKTGRLGGG